MNRNFPGDTIGRFRLEDIELVELEELPLKRINSLSFSNSIGGRSIVTGYRLEHNLYSANGRLVARKGKMRRAEGDYLLQQAEKRKYYSMMKDIRKY
ncbi:hypothetical protein HY500_00395 [Candidatus Woesearchaeota archaeon]|nr:hypothetical protein [Candidatus Woesearchaeota archaeon]